MLGRAITPAAMLARETLTRDQAMDIIVWGCVLILVLVAAWVGLLLLRRRIYYRRQAREVSAWTLDGVRELRDRGMIDDAEYARMRAAIREAMMAGRAREEAASDAAPPPQPEVADDEPAGPQGDQPADDV
ncbi:MAG: hypothetical protein BIFFINMI_03710 [Phycisphaerae bacterium]|nr:hypothetical protein [Phycisphaerae bacterium]